MKIHGFGEKGFSFIEVLIAATIFSVALLTATGFLQIISDNSAYNRNFLVSNLLSQAKIEELKNYRFTVSALNPTWSGLTPNADLGWTPHAAERLSATALATPAGIYQRQWRIAPDQPSSGMKLIEVRTKWFDRGSKEHQIGLRTAKFPE